MSNGFQPSGADEGTSSWLVEVDHPAFAGHFPGQPILPGVAILAAVLEALRREPALYAFVGAEPHLSVSKFLAPVRPGATLTLAWQAQERTLGWTVREGERGAASGQFNRASMAAA